MSPRDLAGVDTAPKRRLKYVLSAFGRLASPSVFILNATKRRVKVEGP
jgi:hypothetical protein